MDVNDRSQDHYEDFSAIVETYFVTCVSQSTPLFTTNAEGLWDAYLNNIPEVARQHYNCHSCRHFINHFGGLVCIHSDGTSLSPIWNYNQVPDLFKASVRAMERIIKESKVNGVFISKEQTLGYPVTGEWSHLSVKIHRSSVFKSLIKTPYQEMAEKSEDFKMLISALLEYPVEIVNQSINLLKSETLYRSDKCLGVAEWFKKLIDKRTSAMGSSKQTNVVWLSVATAPAGYCHVKSSMIGTLLDDLKSGLDYAAVSRRFAEKMNPTNYMRSQVAPTQGNIENAEKIVEKLGIANSLKRRYATIDEIPVFEWRDKKTIKVEPVTGKVFANVTPKKNEPEVNDLEVPPTVMTWEKFKRTVIPSAEAIYAKVTNGNSNRFAALVTASDATAANILQWDNPFSWYYHGGVDGEIKRRVEIAGGQYENNEIRCSLIWEGFTDLDLHCVVPGGDEIYYAHKRSRCNGWLDVDANGNYPTTTTPVENIRWSEAPNGSYRFFVQNFRERGNGRTPYKVELQVNSQVFTYVGIASNTGYVQTVFEFDYIRIPDRIVRMLGMIRNGIAEYELENSWGVSANFVKVNGIVNSPNTWGDKPVLQAGQHVFFLLDGCKDATEGKGRGFFNEMLKSDLREIRKTLESYMANTAIEGSEAASACGLGYSKDSEWNLILKVKSDLGVRFVKIDRWD